MNEIKLAIALLSVLRQFKSITFDELEQKFEKLDRRAPGLIADFDLDTISVICEKHPYELQIYSEFGKPAGLKRGEIWSSEISRVEIERYSINMNENTISLLTHFMYL